MAADGPCASESAYPVYLNSVHELVSKCVRHASLCTDPDAFV